MNQVPLQYSGYCIHCQETHFISSRDALPFALELMNDLTTHKHLEFEKQQRSPLFSTANLYQFSGQMFGVLLCKDVKNQSHLLKAFSGTHHGHWLVEGWVPPVINVETYQKTLLWGDSQVHPLTEQINRLPPSIEKKNLEWQRKLISQETRKRYLDSYRFHNFKNQDFTIYEIVPDPLKIHMGTGDCCAPKLLNYAALKEFEPISLAEFYLGKDSKDGSKKEGYFYASCQERCAPILGTLLCGSKIVSH